MAVDNAEVVETTGDPIAWRLIDDVPPALCFGQRVCR